MLETQVKRVAVIFLLMGVIKMVKTVTTKTRTAIKILTPIIKKVITVVLVMTMTTTMMRMRVQ